MPDDTPDITAADIQNAIQFLRDYAAGHADDDPEHSGLTWSTSVLTIAAVGYQAMIDEIENTLNRQCFCTLEEKP